MNAQHSAKNKTELLSTIRVRGVGGTLNVIKQLNFFSVLVNACPERKVSTKCQPLINSKSNKKTYANVLIITK